METTLDAVLDGRLVLEQPARGHRAGTDAILLAACVAGTGDAADDVAIHVVDLGAGVGTAGLAVAARLPAIRLTLVERDPVIAGLAAANAERNGIAAAVLVADVTAPGRARAAAGLVPGMATWVIANPPYFAPGRIRASAEPLRSAAHGLDGPSDLSAWLRTAASLLAPGGRLALVHRAEALPGLLAALEGRFGGVEVRPVYPQEGAPAHRILVRARLGSRAPLVLATPMVLHGADDRFTPKAEALHRGTAFPPYRM